MVSLKEAGSNEIQFKHTLYFLSHSISLKIAVKNADISAVKCQMNAYVSLVNVYT